MSADLHALVQSLSKAERKQVRMQGMHTNGSPSNYLLLLNALLGQPFYNEKDLIEKFAGTKMLGNFSVAKAYLLSAIVRAGTQRQEGRSVEATLRRRIDEVEYLLEKGMDRLARKALEKALHTARAIDLPAHKAELLRWKRRWSTKTQKLSPNCWRRSRRRNCWPWNSNCSRCKIAHPSGAGTSTFGECLCPHT